MRQLSILALSMLTLSLLALSCGGGGDKPTAEVTHAKDLLTENPSEGIAINSEIRVFEGEHLYEHINGGAEIFHLYDFVEVATAYYMRGETEVLADVFMFADADGAYGLYTTLRPDEVDATAIGIEGMGSATSLDFVKGAFVVKLTAYEEAPATTAALNDLSRAIETAIPGSTDVPATFSLLPDTANLPNSEKIFAESYLGESALSDVYCRRYALGTDTVTLFIADDVDGSKLTAWRERVGDKQGDAAVLAGLPFTAEASVVVDNAYYGLIFGGAAGTHLVGAVGYDAKHADFVAAWLNALP